MTRFILREQHHHLVIPRPDLGLFYGRRSARAAAKSFGFPPRLIKKVTRYEKANP